MRSPPGRSTEGAVRGPAAFDPLRFLFTTQTVSGARDVAAALGAHGEVWELRGEYYPVRRWSPEAAILRSEGAELVPAADDELHMGLDALLAALQQIDSNP